MSKETHGTYTEVRWKYCAVTCFSKTEDRLSSEALILWIFSSENVQWNLLLNNHWHYRVIRNYSEEFTWGTPCPLIELCVEPLLKLLLKTRHKATILVWKFCLPKIPVGFWGELYGFVPCFWARELYDLPILFLKLKQLTQTHMRNSLFLAKPWHEQLFMQALRSSEVNCPFPIHPNCLIWGENFLFTTHYINCHITI